MSLVFSKETDPVGDDDSGAGLDAHWQRPQIWWAGKQETKLAEDIVLVLATRLNTQEGPKLQFKSKQEKPVF